MKYCRYCGNKLSKKDKECPECGLNVDFESDIENDDREKHYFVFKFVGSLVAVFAVTVAIISALSFSSDGEFLQKEGTGVSVNYLLEEVEYIAYPLTLEFHSFHKKYSTGWEQIMTYACNGETVYRKYDTWYGNIRGWDEGTIQWQIEEFERWAREGEGLEGYVHRYTIEGNDFVNEYVSRGLDNPDRRAEYVKAGVVSGKPFSIVRERALEADYTEIETEE